MTTEESAARSAHIAKDLRDRAYSSRVSQGRLALAAGVSRSAVNEHLNGRTPIVMSVFLDYCDALGVEPETILRAAQDAARK